jgi:hypothetical protein
MQKFEPRPSEASIKFMSEANSELLLLLPLLFLKFTTERTKNCPRIERKRDSIEFERSENQGQFFRLGF